MSEVRPFAGLRYARFAGPRIAPPYDVLDDAERAALAREPENLVHLTLPPGASGARDYAGAAALFRAWQRDGVLVRDPQPAFYVLEEHTTDGRTRRGFLALLRLRDYADRVVLPHERTMAGPKLDRLLLTREVRANLEPLFFLYEDRDAKLLPALQSADAEAPLVACKGYDGTEIALRALTDRGAVDAVAEFLLPRAVIIADGHHRYETMLTYRDECRATQGVDPEAPHEFVLAYLVNAFDPGSRIQAIHRGLTGDVQDPGAALRAAGFTTVTQPRGTPGNALLQQLAGRRAHETAFVLVEPSGDLTLAVRARGEKLDVEVLHGEVLPKLGGQLEFDGKPERLLERVRRGEVRLAILMNPLDADTLFRVIQAGAVLPQKSTYFAPKIPSGLVIRDF
jgi:uncharacterized protein (DUF1015 family)